MNRARFAVAATLVGTTLYAATALAQGTTQAPPMTSVLAGKKFAPPVKGEALVEFTQPVTKRIKENVETTIRVRNLSQAPIARLQITETWYDKAGAVVGGGKGVIAGLLQPGEIQNIVITTPFKAAMSSNNWNFSHANGNVKPAKVKTLEAPAAPAAAPK